MFTQHGKQFELTVSPQEVLVDRTVGKKGKALLMVSHDNVSAAGVSSDQIRALNCCSCRSASDDTPAL